MSGRVYTPQIEPSSGEPLLRPTSWYANLLPPVEQRPWGKSACFVMFKGRNPNGKYQALDVPFKKFHRYMVTSTYCQDQRPNGQSHNTCWHTWTYVRSTTIKKKSILLPSRGLTYPTLGKGKSSSNMPYQGDMLVPWRVFFSYSTRTFEVLISPNLPWPVLSTSSHCFTHLAPPHAHGSNQHTWHDMVFVGIWKLEM